MMQHSNTFYRIAQFKKEQIMSDILSGIKWFILLIIILAAVTTISECSLFSRTGGESIDPKHISTQEDTKTIVKQFFKEVVGHGNIDVVNALLTPNCKYFDAGRVKTANVQEFIDYLEKARLPFDSIDVKIDKIIAEGNRVVVRYSYHSVLAGELTVVPAMADFLIEDGKVVEMWRFIPARSQSE
jgi:predicted SnoaL-like aldol condensation-catalyzing enzyme